MEILRPQKPLPPELLADELAETLAPGGESSGRPQQNFLALAFASFLGSLEASPRTPRRSRRG